MEFAWQTGSVAAFSGDAVVAFAFSDGALDGALRDLDSACGGALGRVFGTKAFKGEFGDIFVAPLRGGEQLGILVGLGPRAEAGPFQLRRAALQGVRKAQSMGSAQVAIAVAEHAPSGAMAAAEAALIGGAAGAYRFRRYKSGAVETGVERLTVITSAAVDAPAQSRAAAIAEGVAIARELVDTPPNDKTPDLLAKTVAEIAQRSGLACEVITADRLREMGAGGILAVGRGSAHPPAMVVLRHDGGEGPWHGFLGKGITFDSGGLDLKTQDGMFTMKSDMAGTAAVVGAMHALGRIGVKGRYIGVLALAENMTGTGAYRPSDVLRMLSGDTVEVSNTDAEGRLVLADGLALLRREGVQDVIDLATLTGAIVVALGTHRSGLFANDDEHSAAVLAAADLAGERYWRMPIDPEHKEALKSSIADTKSTGGRAGGSSTAAAFLARFAADTPWAHLDIAGAAYRDQPGDAGPGATGVGVETLVRFATKG
jgi:leucyl aminopeptidase